MESAMVGLSAGAFLLALIGAAIAIDWRFAWTNQALRWTPLLIAMAIGGSGILPRRSPAQPTAFVA
jgi:hypothetical protein